MKTESRADRRKFVGVRDKLEHLYHKLLYWLYEREESARALPFADRLARLLSRSAISRGAIFPEECWSLVCETRGDLAGAIAHRKNEIRLIKRLHRISRNTLQEKRILRLYGHDDLSDRLDLLATLYHDAGELDKALSTLHASKKLCEKHGIKFDGKDILKEYQAEKAGSNGNSQRTTKRTRKRLSGSSLFLPRATS